MISSVDRPALTPDWAAPSVATDMAWDGIHWPQEAPEAADVEGVDPDASAAPDWWEPLGQRLEELLDLDANWNSYGAPPIDPEAILFAVDLLLDTMPGNVPTPATVPTSRGGVQLEWHSHGLELEVAILPTTQFSVYFEDLKSGEVRESEMTSDTELLREALLRLSGRVG